MKACMIDAPGSVAVKEVPDPRPAFGEVVVSVAACGVCGTDVHIYDGEMDYVKYPLIPGHEIVGTIEEVGEGVADLKPGMRVTLDPNVPCMECPFCRKLKFNHCIHWQGIGVSRSGGFAERVAVPAKVVYDIGDMPFDVAAFVEPLSCVVYGLQRARPNLADRVLIFGSGPIGLLLLQAIRRAGAAQVVVTDLQQDRLELAEALGAELTILADENQAEVLRENAPLGYDMVVDATGVPSVASRCFNHVTKGGKILLFGVCPDDATFPFSPYDLFHRDLTVYGSFAVNMTFAPAIELLRNGAINVRPLTSHRLSLDEAPRALEIAKTHTEPAMKILIEP